MPAGEAAGGEAGGAHGLGGAADDGLGALAEHDHRPTVLGGDPLELARRGSRPPGGRRPRSIGRSLAESLYAQHRSRSRPSAAAISSIASTLPGP